MFSLHMKKMYKGVGYIVNRELYKRGYWFAFGDIFGKKKETSRDYVIVCVVVYS